MPDSIVINRLGMRPSGPRNNNLKLNLTIKDFGPIQNGTVTLKPLTIFVGPASSGKSYTALLFHAILNVESKLPGAVVDFRYDEHMRTYHDVLKKLLHSNKRAFFLPASLINKLANKILQNVFSELLQLEIDRIFESRFNKLARLDKTSFTLHIETNIIRAQFHFSKQGIKITNASFPKLKVKINLLDHKDINYRSFSLQGNTLTINHIRAEDTDNPFRIISYLMDGLSEYFQNNVVNDSIYIPASRTGLLQSYKTITSSIIQNASYAGLQSIKTLPLPGTIRDFITDMINFSDSYNSDFFKSEINYLEKKIFHGKVNIGFTHSSLPGEIKFTQKKLNLPLQNTSSSIVDLAPVALYLRYMIKLGNVLIIEEPEAHIHPAHQALFAEFLVRLIRKGLYIIINTHSTFLIEKINNFVRASFTKKLNNGKKLKSTHHIYLDNDDVALYAFKQSAIGSSTIKNVKISIDGISHDEFLPITKSLYDEQLKIQNEINGN